MTPAIVHVSEGDELTLTITGKITAPALDGTAGATVLKIKRPGADGSLRPAVDVNAVFSPDAKITYDVKSRYKNGVHIDSAGNYWMRKPDGWYPMTVSLTRKPDLFGRQYNPPGASRLIEDKDK